MIGIESFKGSFRRSCFLQPTLGEPEVQISGTACGGWIDPETLETMPYKREDRKDGMIKGYICPLGQVCKVCQPLEYIHIPCSTVYQEGDNPFNNIESYDNFFYAALQVAIISTQSGVRFDFRPVCANANMVV